MDKDWEHEGGIYTSLGRRLIMAYHDECRRGLVVKVESLRIYLGIWFQNHPTSQVDIPWLFDWVRVYSLSD
jgi:hypothetical protein